MGFEPDFDLESEEELFCPACGKQITCRGPEGCCIKMRCRCGKILNLRVKDGVAIIAAQMRPKDEAVRNAAKRTASCQEKLAAVSES